MRLFQVSCGVFLGCCLAACGGGGGGGGTNPVVPTAPPSANTGLSFYLPLAVGNTWLFSSGGQIVDTATGALQCSCAYNGGKIESHDLLSPSGAYSGTFYFAKAAGIQGSGASITYLVGTSTNHGQTIQLTGSTSTSKGVIPGLGVMDDAPSPSETFSDQSGDTSTISNVNQTVTYSGSTYSQNATDTISAVGANSIVFAFARGVGYTSFSYQGQSATLQSFSVNQQTSYSVRPASFTVFKASGFISSDGVAQIVRNFL